MGNVRSVASLGCASCTGDRKKAELEARAPGQTYTALNPGGKDNACLRAVKRYWVPALLGAAVVLLLVLVLVPSPPLPSRPSSSGATAPTLPAFFQAVQLMSMVPLAPATYPVTLQGVFWMDASGAYGPTTIPKSFEDIAMTFGDTRFSTLDRDARQLSVASSGPAWVWLNNAKAYSQYNVMGRSGGYLYQFNEFYTHATQWPFSHFWGMNFYLPFVSFTLRKPPVPAAGACPPAANATQEDRAVCAAWVRESCLLGCIGSSLGFNKLRRFYIWQVVDGSGLPVQPYYNQLVNYTLSVAKPDADAAAKTFNVTLAGVALLNGTLFHGQYTTPWNQSANVTATLPA